MGASTAVHASTAQSTHNGPIRVHAGKDSWRLSILRTFSGEFVANCGGTTITVQWIKPDRGIRDYGDDYESTRRNPQRSTRPTMDEAPAPTDTVPGTTVVPAPRPRRPRPADDATTAPPSTIAPPTTIPSTAPPLTTTPTTTKEVKPVRKQQPRASPETSTTKPTETAPSQGTVIPSAVATTAIAAPTVTAAPTSPVPASTTRPSIIGTLSKLRDLPRQYAPKQRPQAWDRSDLDAWTLRDEPDEETAFSRAYRRRDWANWFRSYYGTTGPRTDALSTWIEDTYGDNYPDVTDDAGLIDETVAEILAFGVNHKSKNLVNENDGMTKAFEKKFGQLKKDKGKPKKRTEAYTGQELSNWAMAPTYTMDGEPVHGTTFDLKKGISRLNAEATHGRYVQGNLERGERKIKLDPKSTAKYASWIQDRADFVEGVTIDDARASAYHSLYLDPAWNPTDLTDFPTKFTHAPPIVDQNATGADTTAASAAAAAMSKDKERRKKSVAFNTGTKDFDGRPVSRAARYQSLAYKDVSSCMEAIRDAPDEATRTRRTDRFEQWLKQYPENETDYSTYLREKETKETKDTTAAAPLTATTDTGNPQSYALLGTKNLDEFVQRFGKLREQDQIRYTLKLEEWCKADPRNRTELEKSEAATSAKFRTLPEPGTASAADTQAATSNNDPLGGQDVLSVMTKYEETTDAEEKRRIAQSMSTFRKLNAENEKAYQDSKPYWPSAKSRTGPDPTQTSARSKQPWLTTKYKELGDRSVYEYMKASRTLKTDEEKTAHGETFQEFLDASSEHQEVNEGYKRDVQLRSYKAKKKAKKAEEEEALASKRQASEATTSNAGGKG